MKNNIKTFIESKGKSKLSVLTAYDYSTAKIIDQSGVNGILVGDSLGMVCLGYKDTLSVTVDDMIHHGKAVVRGVENALVIIDMPFMSYEVSIKDALVNAGRIIKETGAQALKLEGGLDIVDTVRALVKAKIPVMGHLGLTPQSVNVFGGFKVQGKDAKDAQNIIDSALALEEAGAFAIVLECVPSKLAKIITEKLSIPTIGIGGGPDCDGQVLVWQDSVGLFSDFTPKFVKKYAEVGKIMTEAFTTYDKEVKDGTFPEEKHCFTIKEDELSKLY
jgi:3-methyl-2-oxobutanoate hydroxymethyltransferase